VLPFSVTGIGVSTYHYLLQKTDLFASSAVCDTGIPCTTTWINLFGFMTIPFLALLAFLTISFMGLFFYTLTTEPEAA
jgi:disulfide bond formation protein DsbB